MFYPIQSRYIWFKLSSCISVLFACIYSRYSETEAAGCVQSIVFFYSLYIGDDEAPAELPNARTMATTTRSMRRT